MLLGDAVVVRVMDCGAVAVRDADVERESEELGVSEKDRFGETESVGDAEVDFVGTGDRVEEADAVSDFGATCDRVGEPVAQMVRDRFAVVDGLADVVAVFVCCCIVAEVLGDLYREEDDRALEPDADAEFGLLLDGAEESDRLLDPLSDFVNRILPDMERDWI